MDSDVIDVEARAMTDKAMRQRFEIIEHQGSASYRLVRTNDAKVFTDTVWTTVDVIDDEHYEEAEQEASRLADELQSQLDQLRDNNYDMFYFCDQGKNISGKIYQNEKGDIVRLTNYASTNKHGDKFVFVERLNGPGKSILEREFKKEFKPI